MTATERLSSTGGEQPERRERWLVISHAANINGEACSHHIDDRLPHLRAAGVEVEVITSICGPRPPGWGSRWHRVPSIDPAGYQFEVRQITRGMRWPWRRLVRMLLTLPAYPLYLAERRTLHLDSTFGWWMSAALGGLLWSRRRRYDLIYSTGGAVSGHVAAMVISWARGLPWIAEFQDPLVHIGLQQSRAEQRWRRWLERLVHRRAQGVIYLTRAAADSAMRRTAGEAQCRTIRPGAPPLPATREADGTGQMRIVHVGTLRRARNPGALLEALKLLTARDPSLRTKVRVFLVGDLDRQCMGMVRAFPHPEMVCIRGKVPRQAALEEIAKADLLLLVQDVSEVASETIPSKTYEYLVSGRPILGLVCGNTELQEMLREAGHTCVDAGDAEAIRRALSNAYERWLRGELRAEPCLRYTPELAARELIAWSRQVRTRDCCSGKAT